jgi:hypothetical protein
MHKACRNKLFASYLIEPENENRLFVKHSRRDNQQSKEAGLFAKTDRAR